MLEDVRPRSLVTREGLMVVLRGVNLNPGQQREDMVALRMWIDDRRVITLRRRHLLSIDDLRERIKQGVGPVSPGTFLVDVADRLVERMAKVISDVEDVVDRLDEQIATGESRELRTRLSYVRREAILLRLYIAPQRDAMSRLFSEPVEWLDDTHRIRLGEIADRTMRYVDDLDAALFLPLGFVTGLLGVNVAGIPGTEHPGAFLAVCFMLLLLALLQLWLFRRRGRV